MIKKSPQSEAKTPEEKIIAATLFLAARNDWGTMSLDQIAKKAKISTKQVQKKFPTANHILSELVKGFDSLLSHQIFENYADSTNYHDRLFDVLMARIELLQSHRFAIVNIIQALQHNPSLVGYILPYLWQSMEHILKLVEIPLPKSAQFLATTGLLAVYLGTLYVWKNDDSSDLARTMAALDLALRRSAQVAAFLVPNAHIEK